MGALIFAACWSRRPIPAFFTGIGLYLAGHAMESTVFPLELYFEHRNYLPSFGFFLALVGLGAWALPYVFDHAAKRESMQRLLNVSVCMLLALLGAASFARATAWSSWPVLAAQGAREHPDSMRAQLDHANMLQLAGRYDEAQKVFDHLATIPNPAARHVAAIDSVALECMAHGATTSGAAAHMGYFAGAKLQLAEMLAFENLANYLEKHKCVNLDKVRLAATIISVVNAAPQSGKLTQVWRSRFVAARLYQSAGLLPQAIQQAALAWMTGAADPAVGVFLANLYYVAGNQASARLILADVEKHIEPWDRRNLAVVAELKQHFENPATKPPTPSHK